MVKCVVSGCPNRLEVKGLFNRPQKRFFNLPRDAARVKVWLAALRETDKLADCLQDSHIICEDHFLPEHVTPRGISDDAIPLMPPYLDGPLGSMMAAGLHEEDEEDEVEGDEPAAVVEKQQDGGGTEEHQSAATADGRDDVSPKPPDPKTHEKTPASTTELSYLRLTRRLMELLCAAPNGSLDLGTAAVRLQACRRRLNDVTGVLAAFRLIRRPAPNQIQWIAESPVTSYLGKSDHAVQEELGHLKVVEETLDVLIKTCAQQLFDMTDDTQNTSSAYVTHEDISGIPVFQGQTVLVVKAPEETKLEVPTPTEDNIQMHLKAGKGPITVLTCEMGRPGQAAPPTGSGESAVGCFLHMEQSKIKTHPLHTETQQKVVQSA